MKVGEEGLVPRTGAEFMALETTAEAGTCLAWRSMLGLVGSSARAEGAVGEALRRLNLSVPPAPASHPGRDHIPKAPEALQGPAGSMPTAEGADPPWGSQSHPPSADPPTVVTEAQPLPPPSH